MSWRDRLGALLGVSAYSAPPVTSRSLNDPDVEAARARLGGQITPLPATQTRWLLADLESAQVAADNGDLSHAARLLRAMRSDGVYAGHLASRTGRAVRLPKKFSGDPMMVSALQGRDGARSVFDDMFPPSELEALADDGLMLGVGVAEMMPVAGRDYPVMVRLEPEFLRYRWQENRWYYQCAGVGQIPITPGDRWILHTPGGRMSPWQRGLWNSCGRAYITKSHAELFEANWESKLAHPARAAYTPLGATEPQRAGFLQRLIAWGINTTFELPAGWDVKIIESNGRGFESFGQTITRSDRTYAFAICGQVVTGEGGKGFSNSDVSERVLTALVDVTAEAISYTINTQGTPSYIAKRWGDDALDRMPIVSMATTPAKDLKADAETMKAVAEGIAALRTEAAYHKSEIDVAEVWTKYSVPIKGDVDGDGTPDAAKPADLDGEPPPAAEPANDVEESLAVDVVAALAAKMTEHGVDRCEHGSSNRCRLCGIERTRDFEPGVDGAEHAWRVAWRPITTEVAA